MKTLLYSNQVSVVIKRLAHQLVEQDGTLNNTVLIGLQPRGIFFSNRINTCLKNEFGLTTLPYGKLDITFYRDDVHNTTEIRLPESTEINFSVDGKRVILIDDVLYTGRTIRSALDAILDYGRPASIELMVLVDRRFNRELPIQANYVGISIDSIISQKVKVLWAENNNNDEVILLDK